MSRCTLCSVFALLAAGLAPRAATAAAAEQPAERTSFTDARTRIYAEPLEQGPAYESVDVMGIFRMAVSGRGATADRAHRLFRSRVDFRAPAPKATHAPGVCAEATWEITGSSQATGLFAAGSKVPAITRFSVATNDAVYAHKARSFSLAVKFFPATSVDDRALTVNLPLSDPFGINGQDRPLFLDVEPRHGALTFANHIWGQGPVSVLLDRAFKRADRTPGSRPLYPLATVDAAGNPVPFHRAPRTVQLVLRPLPHPPQPTPDFRDELRQYQAGDLVFDVVLPPQEVAPDGAVLGTLTVGKPVVSKVCDLELSFYHHPTDPEDEVK